MGKIRNPVKLSTYVGLSAAELENLGILDVFLATDTPLHIDPLMLAESAIPEMSVDAVDEFEGNISLLMELLLESHKVNDVAWVGAKKVFSIDEIKETSLGYGDDSTSGSAFGPKLTRNCLTTAQSIVKIGVRKPHLFTALGMLEDKVGADRISDLATNFILKSLAKFNKRVLKNFDLPTCTYDIKNVTFTFLKNPCTDTEQGILLVPVDIVRDLPIATSWDEVAHVAMQNETFRGQVNNFVSELFADSDKRSKKKLKDQVASDIRSANTLLNLLENVGLTYYNSIEDSKQLVNWSNVAKDFSTTFPLKFSNKQITGLKSANLVVIEIIKQFSQLVENNGLWKNLWHDNKAVPEKYMQKLFFAIAYSYCVANNIDMSPEVDSGNGPVDFKFSRGVSEKVLIEIKRSSNTKVVAGYQNQLSAYKNSEETIIGHYLIVDVGKLGNKHKDVLKLMNNARTAKLDWSQVWLVDATPQESASNR